MVKELGWRKHTGKLNQPLLAKKEVEESKNDDGNSNYFVWTYFQDNPHNQAAVPIPLFQQLQVIPW